MAPQPKKRRSKSKQGKRRSHLALKPVALVSCPQCHSPRLPHHVCSTCGHYAGREAIKIKSAPKKE